MNVTHAGMNATRYNVTNMNDTRYNVTNMNDTHYAYERYATLM